jgi:Nucleotidyl transferase AbiEii toxin, Type IV TA system
MDFSPHAEILPAPQQRLWPELSSIPHEFVLYGGTALALQLGHRTSIDFDFFGSKSFDESSFELGVGLLAGAKITQRDKNTLSVILDRDGPIKVSFFGVPNLPRLTPPLVATQNGLQVASLLDIAGTKVSVIQVRGEAKDYIDIDALINLGGLSLSTALAAGQRLYGTTFNPEITLKALTYFGDGNLAELPSDLRLRLVTAVREVDLDRLPDIQQSFGATP